MNIYEEIINKISSDKQVLEIMPKNNKKNTTLYLEKNEQIASEYSEIKNKIIKEMTKRYNKYAINNCNEDTTKIKRELTLIENRLIILDDIKTSYEKMGLDKELRNLTYYYENDLKKINDSIVYALKKFNEVGVRLVIEDFSYSEFAKEYIKVFFIEKSNKRRVNSVNLKKKFEEIYWKCPNLLTHISLNFKYLYLKFEKVIDRYYFKKKQEILRYTNKQELLDRHYALRKQLISNTTENKKWIIFNILEGNINPRNYLPNQIKKVYSEFVPIQKIEKMSTKVLNELDLNLKKLLDNLYEYKHYNNLKFIIDNVKKIYAEKDKYKTSYKDTKSEIKKLEKNLKKVNKSVKHKIFKRKNDDNYLTKQNDVLMNLKQKYNELSNNKVFNLISLKLTDKSTLKDILNFSNSFYKYIILCLRENGIPEEEFEEYFEELKEFVMWQDCTILNNITILDDKDIALIIKDRYNMVNIDISLEQLNEENLDNTIKKLENLNLNYNIRKNKINIEELIYICEYKNILKK